MRTSIASVALQPDLAGDGADQLTALDRAGGRGALSAALFVVAQLFFAPAVVGVAHLLRAVVPRLADAVAALATVGAFGHTAFGGTNLLVVSLATDSDDRAAFGRALDDFHNSPAMLLAVAGLVGTVLALFLLAVALWRSRIVARWVPAAIVVFLVLGVRRQRRHCVGLDRCRSAVPRGLRRACADCPAHHAAVRRRGSPTSSYG
jgi:hypothetical protein